MVYGLLHALLADESQGLYCQDELTAIVVAVSCCILCPGDLRCAHV